MDWIDVKERTPDLIEGKDYSENVLAVLNGRLAVMAYCYIKDDDGGWFYAWANCYGNIDGECEWDDNYNVTHWMPLPDPPQHSMRAIY